MSQVIALVDDDRNILTTVSIGLQAEGLRLLDVQLHLLGVEGG